MAEITVNDTAAESAAQTTAGHPSLLAPLRIRDFRLLWAGESISLLGDQFYMVALPWLVLQLTGSGLALGTVLLMAGIPRAVFMIVGGALTDRFSPRFLMLASNGLRVVLTVILTTLVLTNTVQLWMLYVLAFAFGVVDAFFFPAQSAILPHLVGKEHLEAGNALVQITAQLSSFVGPALAGLIIASFVGTSMDEAQRLAEAGGTVATQGIATAFGFDMLTFIVATAALWMMTGGSKLTPSGEAAAVTRDSQGLLGSIREGLYVVWSDPVLRILILITASINFLFNGPIGVGIPVIAASRFPEGAAAFGIIVSAFGGGALAGALVGGSLPRPRYFGLVALVLVALAGLEMIGLGLAPTLPIAVLIALAMGVMMGYINVTMISWLQRRTDPAMMGRVSSLVMLGSLGLQPLSNFVAGVLVEVNTTFMFAAAGVLIVLVSALAATSREMRTMH